MSDSEVITIRVNSEEKKHITRIMEQKKFRERSKAIKFAIKIMYYSLE